MELLNALLAAALAALPLGAEPVTFNKDIAPIVFHSCAPCHRPGEAAPFPLLTYEDVKRHASQIVQVTLRHYMPPWPPEPGYGNFEGVRRLSDAQIEQFARWVEEGAQEGHGADLPPAPHFTEGWELGPPDLVAQIPRPFTLPGGGGDVFRNFVVALDLKETRYVRAIELRPGNKRVVHHANVLIDHARSWRARDGADGQPGFPGMDLITESGADFEPDSHFLFWKPGSPAQQTPDEMAWRLNPGDDLIVNLHLQPSGKAETVQPVLGLYFAKQAPRRFPILLQLEHDGAIKIPPGARDFSVSDELRLPVDCDVLAIYPHAHYVGKRIEAWAILPGGERRWLVRINDWDINWQAVYTYREPVALPKGTTVHMRIEYDNSAENPRNPNHPPKRVLNGDRSEDEMGHVWLQVLPHGGQDGRRDPRAALEEALMRRRLEKYPSDFVANFNLGGLLQMEGKHQEALGYFEKALAARPDNAAARNSHATSLLVLGRPDEAVRELKEALARDPGYASARYNLARALEAQGDAGPAIALFLEYLKDHPEDAQAHVHLSNLYIAEQHYEAALPQLREASRLKPDDADIATNLGTALAIRGYLEEAIAAYERALRLDPNHQTARANLERARARLAKP
ncbi:MAG TPA: tetratricopeptide repeat protein [Bryobacteraceae bacterium]|nr:tetratricopeptide repeat protein [Bryobacteraceae bacterium]